MRLQRLIIRNRRLLVQTPLGARAGFGNQPGYESKMDHKAVVHIGWVKFSHWWYPKASWSAGKLQIKTKQALPHKPKYNDHKLKKRINEGYESCFVLTFSTLIFWLFIIMLIGTLMQIRKSCNWINSSKKLV